MLVKDFIKGFKDNKIQNTQIKPNAVEEYIKSVLEIKSYIPFREKRAAVEVIVRKNVAYDGGIKKIDSINQYVSFVVAMLHMYTSLEISDDPVADYDALCEAGLLEAVIETFHKDYSECDILLKMAVASELEDNNISAIIGRFLDDILDKIDVFMDGASITGVLKSIYGDKIKDVDITKVISFIDNLGK